MRPFDPEKNKWQNKNQEEQQNRKRRKIGLPRLETTHERMSRMNDPNEDFNWSEYDRFIEDSKRFLESYSSEVDSMDWSNHRDKYAAREASWEALRTRGEAISSYLEQNRDKYGDDVFNNFQSYMGRLSTASVEQLMAMAKSKDYFAQWESEEDYQNSLRQYGYLQEYQGKSYDEIMDALSKIEDGEEKEWLSAYRYELLKTNDDYDGRSAAGWEKYLADQQAREQEKKDAREDESLWEMFGRWFGPAGPTDTSIPLGNAPEITHTLSADTSYQKPAENWTDEQRGIYGYLYDTDEAAAAAYARYTTENNNQKENQEKVAAISEWATKNGWTGAAATLSAIAMMPLSLADTLSALTEYNARGFVSTKATPMPGQMSNAITSAIATELNKIGTIDESIPVVGGKGLGDAYQLATSIANSMISAYTQGSVGTTMVFFGSASSSTMYEAKDRGATDEQAITLGILSGLAEAAGETFSVENLLNLDSIAFNHFFTEVLVQAGVEASEEGVTTLLNNFADQLVMGDKSNFNLRVNYYMTEKGMNESDAKKKAWLDMANDLAFDMVGGALSGGTSAGIQTGISRVMNYAQQQMQYADVGRTINHADGSVDALLSLANEVAGVSEGRAQRDLNRNIAAVGKKATDRNVGKLYKSVQTANNLANASQNQADIAKSLTRKGFAAETANDIAEALIANYNGQPLNMAQRRLLESVENSTHVKAVISNIISNTQSTVGQRSQNIRDFENGISRGVAQKTVEANVTRAAAEKQFVPEETFEVSDRGQDIRTDTGESIQIRGVSSIGNGQMQLDIGDGNTVDAKSVSYATEENAQIYEAISKLGDKVDADTANKLIRQYDGGNGAVFARGITQAYTYGYYGLHRSELTGESSLASELSRKQREFAYNLGAQYRTIRDQVDKATARAVRSAKAVGAKGVFYRGKDGNVTDFRTYENESGAVLRDEQRTAIEVMERMSQVMGVRFNVFESWVENGKRYYLDENGVKTEGNPNGFYDTRTGEVYIDLEAGNDYQGTMLFTLAHELTHFIRQWSPEHFTKIAKIVFQNGGMQGQVGALVARKQAKAEAMGNPISYDTAMEEAVADGMETILKDGKVVEFMADVKKADRTAWEKIKDWFQDVAKLLKELVSAYSAHSAQTTEGARVAAFSQDLLEQIEQIWAEGAVAAGENYQAAVDAVVKPNAKTLSLDEIITDGAVVTDGEGTKYSIRSMKQDIAEGQMFEDLKTHCGWTQKQVGELRSQLEDLVEYMTPFRDKLDMNETYGREGRRFSPYKPNSDPLYKISMDFSTLCSKRLLTQYVIENLQLRENRPMTAEEQMAIRDMLNEYRKVEKGLQVACAMCYVEAARLKSPKQIGKWLADPETKMRNFFADKNPEFAAYIREKQEDFKESRGYDRRTAKKNMSAKDVRELDKIRPRLRSQYQVSAEEAKIIARAKDLPNSTYLTAGNLADLSESDPVIYSAYTAFVRTATRSKSLETDEPYYYGDSRRDNGNGIVVSDSFIEAVNRENGMRFSSWSDWRIQHMLDYITAVIDNSVRGAAMHGYTKFGEEVRVLGKTGMMFNMSGVAGTQTGLNEDGSLSFSPTESMDVDEAIQLREEFPETAGLQCIGVGNDHITALLRSDIIDYVIPYHVSGLNAGLRRMADIHGWVDYTGTQHATIDKSAKLEDAADREHWHEEPVWSEFFVGYDTGMSGIEAMRASADRYVQMCRDRGLKPKFEQFMKEENYWKLLIDRKMINQKTGNLIKQKAVTPTFDFGTIKGVVDNYVKNYDSGLEARALNHIVENWDSIPKRIKDLKKQGGTKVTKASRAVDTLANQTLAAQPTTKMSGRDIPEGLSPAKYNALLTRKPIQASKKDLAKVNQARVSKYSRMEESEIPDLDIFSLAEYGKINEGYLYFVRNNGKGNFVIVGKKQIVPAKRHVTREEQIAYEESNGRKKTHPYDVGDGSGRRADSGDIERSGDGSKLRENDTGAGINGKTVQNGDTWNGTSDSRSGIKRSDRDSAGNQLTEDQQEFFAESKARDESGNLYVLYHGSRSPLFTEFNVDEGVWLTTDRQHAGEYAETRRTGAVGKRRKDGIEQSVYADSDQRLYRMYANITNPLDLGEINEEFDGSHVSRLAKLLDVPVSEIRDIAYRDGRQTVGYVYEVTRDKRFIDIARAKGYDGFTAEEKGRKTFCAFNAPNQVKLTSNEVPSSFYDIRYQERSGEAVSNRALLANALEGVAQNEIEAGKIREYKEQIGQLNEQEQKLRELNGQIKELSFARGPRDKARITALREEATKTANRISTYDKILLRLEASAPLQAVLNREKETVRRKEKEKGKAALDAYKKEALEAQKELTRKWQESRKKATEGRNRTAMRHKIKDVVNELNRFLLHGNKERHVPIELQKAVAEALDAVNMDTVGAEERIARLEAELLKAKTPEKIQEISRKIDHVRQMGDRMNERLQKLKNAYDQFVNSDDPLVANGHDEVISNKLESVIREVGDTPLRDMSLKQLEDVYDMYRMVLTTIRNANKAFTDKKNETISTIAERVMKEIRSVGGKNTMAMKGIEGIKTFGWNNLKPVYAFEHIGSQSFKEIFDNVRAGEDVWAVDITEAKEFYLEQSKKHNYDKWDFKKRFSFESASGMEFSLGLDQIMSLYAYSKRDQAAEHLRRGGIVIDETTEITVKNKLGIPVKYNPTEATAYNIDDMTLAEIVGKLTDEQKAFVDEMQEYLATVMGGKGNAVSLELYGIKLFKDKFYFPLKSATQFMAKAKEQQQGEKKIKNSGFSKETVPRASNPIVLTPFMDVWAGHVNDMSMYHAFVLPMEDFYRVYNYKTQTSETAATESVEMHLQNAYGRSATKYIDQLLSDLNGGARTDTTTGIINKMTGLFKKGAVFCSLSVVVQQPSAIARAAAIVDPKYFIGPKVDKMTHKELWGEVKQYAPVAIIKEMGYFDTNMGQSTRDFILGKEYSGFSEKMKALVTDSGYRDEVLSKAPALADEIAWCGIWQAVKREIKAKNPAMDTKSTAFLQAVGKRFTEVIVKTQVYDSVLARSGLMRSKDTGMKMATAFMAEPTTNSNMVADALLKGKRGDKAFSRRAVGAVIASQILNSILVSFVYAARDDDEDKTYPEKYLGTLTEEMLDSLNPAGYIPFLKDIVSIVQGYDVERSDMAVIADLWKAWENLSNGKLSTYKKVEGFAGSVAQLFGLPVKNLMREVRSAWQIVASFIWGPQTTSAGIGYAVQGSIPEELGGGEVTQQNQLYNAYLSGDETHLARVIAQYADGNAANNAMRSAIKSHFLDGDIDGETAMAYLVEYTGMDEDDAFWRVEEWVYENASGEDFGKYDEFYTAAQTGKDLKAVIQKYTENGVTEETLRSQLQKYFKPLYMQMSTHEKADIKGYLLNALTMLGESREDAQERIGKWEFEADYPEMVGRISYAQYKKWQTDGKPNGVTIELFADVAEYRSSGESGKTRSQDEVKAYIMSATNNNRVRHALWCCFYKASTSPWK